MSARGSRLAVGPFVAAAACYTANCALGALVALRLIDTGRVRWAHHALYIATSVMTAFALASGLWRGRPVRSRRAAVTLAPALIPLAVIPYAGTRTKRHPALALTAAPFFAGAVVRSR